VTDVLKIGNLFLCFSPAWLTRASYGVEYRHYLTLWGFAHKQGGVHYSGWQLLAGPFNLMYRKTVVDPDDGGLKDEFNRKNSPDGGGNELHLRVVPSQRDSADQAGHRRPAPDKTPVAHNQGNR
jgi:hypothetical protein